MYIHLGRTTVISSGTLVGIFDLETTSVSSRTRNFLSAAQNRGEVTNVSEELPASFVLCAGKGVPDRVYITQITSSTLKNRAQLPAGRPPDTA